jgi:ATP-dependent helicase/nuclease subunit A
MAAKVWINAMAEPVQKPQSLTGPQRDAVQPQHDIWLSASAGSGKTQVLSARVLRLLLEPQVQPENLLCLTFTKAAAAEMAERINHRLAGWVQMKGGDLALELEALGADIGPENQARARKLFAKVLDAPGGGLQIMTIHSFCQSVLAAFPEEAGLVPGFEPVEGRAQEELLRDTLAELVRAADASGQDWIVRNIQQMSIDLGESAAFAFLKKCALRASALRDVPDDNGALSLARILLGLNFEGTIEEELARRCADDAIDLMLIRQLLAHNQGWGVKTGLDRADKIAIWLSLDPEARAAMLDDLHYCWATKKNTVVAQYNKKDPAFPQLALAAFEWTQALRELRSLAYYAERLAAALLAGKAFALRYQEVKQQRGLVDFDDMIMLAANLLNRSGMADWVRYKLDRRIDHILVDEAQDTNAAQWDIVRAIASDFHAGAAAKGEIRRTIFAVGDYKQAIYGFQGTDPDKYRDAGDQFQADIEAAGKVLHRVTLAQSFRSTPPILDFVNALIAETGSQALGLSENIDDHFSDRPFAGSIELMKPVYPQGEAEAEEEESEADESWMSEEKLLLADRIARHVRALIDEKPVLATTGKPLVPGDIMILLSKRTQLAGLMVSRLHAAGVPVAGIDRLRISEPIAVQDLMAAVRFALQPNDDLSLACLLVSPLIGWGQQKLLRHGYREKGHGLWRHLRAQDALDAELEPLRNMLKTADLMTPYAFLENILSGATQGRAKFLARLGGETLVPIEELLNQALRFQQEGGSSLQGFLDWFVKGGEIVKRDGLAASSDVRVMTVHGAKGLQAPVVILADTTGDPLKSGDRSAGIDLVRSQDARLPMLPAKKEDRVGNLGAIYDRAETAELREHIRLLYVAMTRAAERLVIAGALGAKSKGKLPEHSWYPKAEAAMQRLGCAWEDDQLWGATMRYAFDAPSAAANETSKPIAAAPALPDWLHEPAPAETIPPRPLSPSNLDDDLYGEAPAPAALRNAAKKGQLMHMLFQLYDGSDLVTFGVSARNWLARHDPDQSFDHAAAVDQIAAVLAHPDWRALFSSQSRAEVPLAALVGTTMITGRVDRLLVEADRVRVIDFKTGRHVPGAQEDVALPVLRQMAHYSAALETIFPGKMIEAALLYTSAPKLIALDDGTLSTHKPQSSCSKQIF